MTASKSWTACTKVLSTAPRRIIKVQSRKSLANAARIQHLDPHTKLLLPRCSTTDLAINFATEISNKLNRTKVLDVDELSRSSGDHVTDLRYTNTVRHKEQNPGIIDRGCHGTVIYNEVGDTGDVADLAMIGHFIERTL